jgi:hypothetical protein
MKHGKTAVYTILKNELKYIDKWLYYAEPFDYKVLLDTGSTDGSWEYLKSLNDPKLIIEQKIFDPWRFDTARKHNISMIPDDVVWCLSPDLDEYFSINTHDEMERIIDAIPTITNIACDRLDLYSRTVRVGPPNFLPTNKIHLKDGYTWVQPIYEHLSWVRTDRLEYELYSDDIFLIHDQDFKKQERTDLYINMMENEYKTNPTNVWVLWFLIYHYYKSQQYHLYVPAACDFVKYSTSRDKERLDATVSQLHQLFNTPDIPEDFKKLIFETIKEKGLL